MKITGLKIDNFKRIKAVHLSDLGDLVTISGDNAQGKSSIIDAIWNTLAGAKGAKVVKPIREGAKKATSVLELTDDEGKTIVVTREWAASGSKLSIHAKGERGSWAKPQDVLNDLIGAFAFDPLEFATMKEAPQLETLLALVDLDFDLADLDGDIKGAYEERTIVNRELKQKQGAFDDLDDVEPTARVDVSALYAELQAAEQIDRQIAEARQDWERYTAEIKELEAQLLVARATLDRVKVRGGELKLKQVDTTALVAQISGADEANLRAAQFERWQELGNEVEETRSVSEALTTQIDELKATRRDGLAKAKFPIDGLGFTSEGVTYNDKPFADASQAEKIIVSFSMAMAMNPEVRVVCIKDANIIDSKNLKLLQDLAEKNDYQVFLELVEKDDIATVIIEDGMIKP